MDSDGVDSSIDASATLPQRIDLLIAECRRRGAGPRVEEVERLYTDGCAEILALEAQHRRIRRRLAADRPGAGDDTRSAPETEALSERSERVAAELDNLRSDLRQLRAALEWAQSAAEIEQRIGFDQRAADNGGTIVRRDRSERRKRQPGSCSPPVAS